jgi:hypothetical protein
MGTIGESVAAPLRIELATSSSRRRLADRLTLLAEAVVQKTPWSDEHLGSFVSRHLLGSEHYGEYVRNTIARYEDLQTLASQLGGEIWGCRMANDRFGATASRSRIRRPINRYGMALEPAASCVTIRCSNQLNYPGKPICTA